MEEIQHHHHHHHHHHHGHDTSHENQGQQYATSSQNWESIDGPIVTRYLQQQQQQQNQQQQQQEEQLLSFPVRESITVTKPAQGGVQTTGSFHSVSSVDSSAEMSKYFPDAQTPDLSAYSHQQQAEGQVQSTAASNTVVTTNINTVNAGPYIPVSVPTAVQRLPQPIRAPFMAQQQQQQRPVRPPGPPQFPSGIPSYSSQIEGLSVSQAVVNDVLVDLQSKVINETLQQYHDESSSGSHFEPLPPIYIRAPQPTIILRSDLHRLRAELGNRVRPPVVYRHPTGANQFQQHQFQQNTFQAPRFPVPPQQHIPPAYYGQYQNPAYASSDEYKPTTTGDEHRQEGEERLYNQAESPMLNGDNINDNVHNAFDLQGLSTTSFDRHASPYQSSSFLPNFGDQQQGNEETVLTSSHNINNEEVRGTGNMFSRPVRPRQEITFDINNCVSRCFEAHRQRVARRRAARQARRARRHKQSGQPEGQEQQHQQLYHSDQYQNISTQPTYSSFGTIEQSQWEQQPLSSSHYADVNPDLANTSTSVHTSQGPYISAGAYDYTNVAQTASLPTDIQQYQSSDIINTHTSQIPLSSLSTSNTDAAVPTDYYQYNASNTQEPYIHSNAYEYNSQQAAPSTNDTIQQSSIKQQQKQEAQMAFDYSSQLPYSSFSSAGTTVPSDIEHLTSEYYQQQQVPTQFIQNQGTYVQPSNTFEYTTENTQTQLPTYDYQNIEKQSFQFPYNVENTQQQQPSFNYGTIASTAYAPPQTNIQQTEQNQTFNYSDQALNSSDYYQQQPIPAAVSQVQGAYGQPTGTFEYTRESYQSQEPIYDYQGANQQSSQYSHNVGDIQQLTQQDSYNYATTTAANTYALPQIDTNLTGQQQTFDYSNQALTSSDYYQQQPVSISASQTQEAYAQPSGTFEYNAGSTQSQEPIYNYQNVDQISSQYPYNIENIEQQSFDYTSGATAGYIPSKTNIQQTEQNQTFDYSNQALNSSDYYQQQPIPTAASQVQGAYGQPTGTFEYTRESYQSQEPIYDYQGANQQPSQYSSNIEDIQQQQQQYQQPEAFNYASDVTTAYSTSGTEIQQSAQNPTIDYSSQNINSSDYYHQQPISIPVSHTYDSQLLGQRKTGASVPTGTVEYTRQAYYSQEPLPDNYTTENFIEQRQQQEAGESFNINDYLKRFETESYSQQIGGQPTSSDDLHSISTVVTTPFIIQQNVDIHSSQGASQTYDLQNYTNESIISETSQPPLSSSIYEEDQQRLLQQTYISEHLLKSFQQPEQRSEIEASSHETTSSSLPPPPSATEEIDHQQESIATNISDFPPPPTPDHHTYQIPQQRSNRSHTSIIPSTDQPSIYSDNQPGQPTSQTSSDHGTDDDMKEDEDTFDLRQCIANCYAKYQDVWNKEEQRQYEEQLKGSQYQQRIPEQSITSDYQEQPRQYLSTGEIHYNEGWTQTPSLDLITQSNTVQHTYDQTPSTFDTQPYIPQLLTRDLSTDSRGQQTIEYSPPLITQARHITHTIPSPPPLSSYEYTQHEQQQQQQPIYDHTLPVPPHLSFNDTDYQSNLYYPSQITAQPRQYQNIPFDTYEQQRYRAHSEPASIHQDTITSIPPLQATSSQIFEQKPQRSISIPMFNQQQARIPPIHLLDNGRAYETDAIFQRHIPRIDPKTGLCLVPCPDAHKYAHLPPHLRPELFCIELPPPSSLPPVPPPPPPVQQQRWCVKCCCVPGQTLIKKVVYKQAEEEKQYQEEQYDYASVIDQMGTRISVRYGNSLMEEGDAFIPGNYHEQLRVIDFPVYVSGQNDSNLTPLVPVN